MKSRKDDPPVHILNHNVLYFFQNSFRNQNILPIFFEERESEFFPYTISKESSNSRTNNRISQNNRKREQFHLSKYSYNNRNSLSRNKEPKERSIFTNSYQKKNAVSNILDKYRRKLHYPVKEGFHKLEVIKV